MGSFGRAPGYQVVGRFGWSPFMAMVGLSLLGGDEVYHLSGEVPGPSLASWLSGLSGLEAAPGFTARTLLEYWIGSEDLLLRGVSRCPGGRSAEYGALGPGG